MAQNISLADQAVQALALVQAMDEGLDMECPERHAVYSMRRVAEQAIAAGFRTAIDLAWQAKDLRKLAREIEASEKPHNVELTGAARLYRAASSD